MTGIEANKNLVLSFMEYISTGNIRAALAMMADNATWWVAGKPDKFILAGTKTKKEFVELLRKTGAILPNGVRTTPTGITAEGDRVAVQAESYGETTSGKIYSNMYHFLFVVREGKIQSVNEYMDTMHAKEVLADR